MSSSAPVAASIFLDIFNIFLFFLELFGSERGQSLEASTRCAASVLP